MRKRAIIAIVCAFTMLFTTVPGFAFANAETKTADTQNVHIKSLHVKKLVPLSGMTDYLEMLKQEALNYLDEEYMYAVKEKKAYASVIWKEINEVYKEGRLAINKAATIDDTIDAFYEHFGFLEWMGKLDKTKVKGIGDLKKIKTGYKDKINKQYKKMKKSNYTAYYWDVIQDKVYMGKKKINAAITFKAAVWGYVDAIYRIKYAPTKKDLKQTRIEVINDLARYINIGLDKSNYSAKEWASIKAVYDKAAASVNKQFSEEGMIVTYYDAQNKLVSLTAEDFAWIYPYAEALLDKLDAAYDQYYDEDIYSDNAIDAIDNIYDDAWEAIVEATTRSAVKKMFNKGIKGMAAVPTMKQEIKAFKAKVPKGLKVTATKGHSVKLRWKRVDNASFYRVYRANSVKGPYKKIGTTYSTKFTNKKLTKGKTYYYKIRAVNNDINYPSKYYSKYSKKIKTKPVR